MIIQNKNQIDLNSMIFLCISAFSYLAGVLSTLQEAGAEHGGGDPVGVGAFAVLLGQDWQIQAVQALQTTDWDTQTQSERLPFKASSS